jgi:exodeoxyribonuclease VIII
MTGLYPGTSRAAYFAIDGANFSTLKGFAKSAAHVAEYLLHPPPSTPAMILGTHIHAAVLEPARFDRDYVLAPKVDRRTTVGKAAWATFEAENAGKELLDRDDFDLVLGIRDAVWAHPTAKALLSGAGHCEVGAVWKHERTGLACKGMMDRIGAHGGWTWIVDLKTCEDASPAGFARSVANYAYHAQAAFYLGGCNAIAPMKRRFTWIAVEKKPPYAVAVYEPDSIALDTGERRCEDWLDAYAECRRTDVWPGYPDDIQSIALPKWATREETFSE